ncbi:MAG: serine/threonine protein kinase [Sandaracinaceae bacterium]|nr:serine/threonine protein kinase [Sandaracinaceae bacterium]
MSGPITKRGEGADPMLGLVIDERYRIERQLGEGGIGRVYVAHNLRLGRDVALKTLLTRYESVPVLKERFSREAAALASLSHPNIVTVTDFGVWDGTPYLVMELLKGEDLSVLLMRPDPLHPIRALRIIRQMVRALAYAHEQELVHRDLKPQNVFVRALGPYDDHVEVLDFGLARFMSDAWKNAPKLTAQGALIGTPMYMAPEQASGHDVDASADVYAAGCVLFESLTGRRVFDGKNQGDIIRAHMLEKPLSLVETDPGLQVTPQLEALVARCLEKSPSRRYPNGRALLEALDALGPEPAVRVGPRPSLSTSLAAGLAATQTATRASGLPTPAPMGNTGGPIELPQRRTPLILGGIVAALILMGIGAGAVYLVVVGLGPPTPAADPGPVAVPVEPPPAALPDAGRPEARQPFAGEIPPVLEPVYRELAASRGNWRDQIAIISGYQSEHRQDPIPALLLGHIYTAQGIYEPALTQYDAANTADATVRGDPWMRQDLLRIVREEAHADKAGALIRDVWGRELLTDLDAYAATERMTPEEAGRLTALRARLDALPR